MRRTSTGFTLIEVMVALAIVAITLGAGIRELKHTLAGGVGVAPLVAGVLSAAIVGVLAIRGLLRFLSGAGFAAFFLYRLALAALIVVTVLRIPSR